MNAKELLAVVKSELSNMWESKSGNMSMVSAAIGLIILISVLFIGLVIVDGIQKGTELEAGDAFYNTSLQLVETTESSYTMAGMMPMVLIAIALLSSLMLLLYAFSKR